MPNDRPEFNPLQSIANAGRWLTDTYGNRVVEMHNALGDCFDRLSEPDKIRVWSLCHAIASSIVLEISE